MTDLEINRINGVEVQGCFFVKNENSLCNLVLNFNFKKPVVLIFRGV